MSKFCPKCGRENLDEAYFCANCGYDFKKLNDTLDKDNVYKKDNSVSLNLKNILIFILIIVIIGFIAFSFSGNANETIPTQNQPIISNDDLSDEILDIDNSDGENITTHEFNYSNKASFNLSDSLTDKTEVKTIVFGEGVSYEYDDGSACFVGGLVAYEGSDEIESRENEAYVEEIGIYPTSQGYDGYIFKYDPSNRYEVLIDLNNMTIVESNGFESEYDYFYASFHSLNEAKVFVDTFKINENAMK